MISHELWQSEFGGSGRARWTVRLDARSRTIVGAARPGVSLERAPSLGTGSSLKAEYNPGCQCPSPVWKTDFAWSKCFCPSPV
jgi:hypothetical protein